MDLATFVHVHVTFLVDTFLLAYDEVRKFEGKKPDCHFLFISLTEQWEISTWSSYFF